MRNRPYPDSLADIQQWSRKNGVTTREANIRFMEFVILSCFGSDQTTGRGLVLKGGNALRFAYQSPRSTTDLDFSVDEDGIPDDDVKIREILDNALRHSERRFGVKAKCQRVKRNPNKPEATRPTYDVRVGYQFPGDAYFHSFEDRHVTTVIPVEVSINDLVCETSSCSGIESLRVCSLDDILAEKLRSLLQQRTRGSGGRNRYQDAYDIARNMRQSRVDRRKISDYLKQKSSIRDIDVRKSAFDEDIRKRAAQDYDFHIREQAPRDFIPFDEAWREVLSLVLSLDIPD